MQLNIKHQLCNVDGNPETQLHAIGFDLKTGKPNQFTEIPLTVGLILKTLLNSPVKISEDESYEVKVKRGSWAMAISRGESPEFLVEDLTLIKELLKKSGFENIVLTQMNELIESIGKPKKVLKKK